MFFYTKFFLYNHLFFVAGDNFMSEMYLRQPRFIYNVCRPFNKNKKRIQFFKETEESRHIYQNELDKASFKNDMFYGDFKDLPRRTAFDKVLHDKIHNIAKNAK